MGTSGNTGGDGESMTTVERVGEGLARQLNRRQTLKRAAVAVFGAVAAWTVEGFRGRSGLAQQCGVVTEGTCSCTPPEGVYCSGLDESFCAGAQCDGGCTYDESYRYAGACWCSATCRYEGGETGYYQCCDCDCYGELCACREFISTGASDEPAPEEPPPDDGPEEPPPDGPEEPRDDGPEEPRDDGRLPPPPGAPPLPPPGYDGPLPPPCFPFCD
ncbi:MAG: hypothetical protein K0Q71_4232 [Thermomicrobiales bacterium]|nr:hypothetical protein [Thermomicrobiales bacterium]